MKIKSVLLKDNFFIPEFSFNKSLAVDHPKVYSLTVADGTLSGVVCALRDGRTFLFPSEAIHYVEYEKMEQPAKAYRK